MYQLTSEVIHLDCGKYTRSVPSEGHSSVCGVGIHGKRLPIGQVRCTQPRAIHLVGYEGAAIGHEGVQAVK